MANMVGVVTSVQIGTAAGGSPIDRSPQPFAAFFGASGDGFPVVFNNNQYIFTFSGTSNVGIKAFRSYAFQNEIIGLLWSEQDSLNAPNNNSNGNKGVVGYYQRGDSTVVIGIINDSTGFYRFKQFDMSTNTWGWLGTAGAWSPDSPVSGAAFVNRIGSVCFRPNGDLLFTYIPPGHTAINAVVLSAGVWGAPFVVVAGLTSTSLTKIVTMDPVSGTATMLYDTNSGIPTPAAVIGIKSNNTMTAPIAVGSNYSGLSGSNFARGLLFKSKVYWPYEGFAAGGFVTPFSVMNTDSASNPTTLTYTNIVDMNFNGGSDGAIDLFVSSDGNTLYGMFTIFNNLGGFATGFSSDQIWIVSTTDGVNWTAKQLLYDEAGAILSPSGQNTSLLSTSNDLGNGVPGLTFWYLGAPLQDSGVFTIVWYQTAQTTACPVPTPLIITGIDPGHWADSPVTDQSNYGPFAFNNTFYTWGQATHGLGTPFPLVVWFSTDQGRTWASVNSTFTGFGAAWPDPSGSRIVFAYAPATGTASLVDFSLLTNTFGTPYGGPLTGITLPYQLRLLSTGDLVGLFNDGSNNIVWSKFHAGTWSAGVQVNNSAANFAGESCVLDPYDNLAVQWVGPGDFFVRFVSSSGALSSVTDLNTATGQNFQGFGNGVFWPNGPGRVNFYCRFVDLGGNIAAGRTYSDSYSTTVGSLPPALTWHFEPINEVEGGPLLASDFGQMRSSTYPNPQLFTLFGDVVNSNMDFDSGLYLAVDTQILDSHSNDFWFTQLFLDSVFQFPANLTVPVGSRVIEGISGSDVGWIIRLTARNPFTVSDAPTLVFVGQNCNETTQGQAGGWFTWES